MVPLLSWVAVLSVALPAVAAVWLALDARPRAAKRAALGALAALVVTVVVGGGDLGLQKTVSALIMPLGLWWLASLGVTLWGLARAPRALGRAMLGLWLGVTLLGNGWLATLALRGLESQVVVRPLPRAPLDVIVVPGGGAAFARDGSAQLSDYGDRVLLAARLFRAGRTRLLLSTGSSISSINPTQDLTVATRTIWSELGVPADAMIGLPEPKNTSQEIAAVKTLAAREGWTAIGMLGSAHHLPRILALCAREGLDVYPIVADQRAGDPIFHPLFAVPSASSLRALSMVAWELLGRAVGR